MLLHTALRPEQVIASPNIIETKKVKQNKTEKFVSNEEENPEKANNETNNLPDKEFKALIIRMLTELEGKTDECSENFKKELETIKNNQSELRNTITKMKNTLQGINSRLSDWTPQVALVVKNPTTNTGDVREPGSISGSGRSSGEENGNPLQYCCLENPIDRGTWQATVHGVAESQTCLE